MSASGPGSAEQTAWKRAASEAAVREVPDGATVGLGTGTTAEQMLHALAGRMRAGLRIRGVATSERTRALAESLGIPMASLDDVDHIDISFDGADEVTLPALDLLKGRGGALLREKLVASSSRYRIILVDVTKIVPTLGVGTVIPVEVETFGWRHTAERLAAPGCRIMRRMLPEPTGGEGAPFISDGGHYILHLVFDHAPDVSALAARIKATTGVVDHGLFLGMTERVYIGGPDGVRYVDRAR
ncbi:MAG TPA: ribose-5-phosphate isomerase RpiA [Ktedonobacterales bacterium]|nr:ribose-5-phosphate isomerase RpiA [Ktedonobacterales bacterium]